jgi:saccharopine dehydrogenase-like NADP-dependent oxidoreductase
MLKTSTATPTKFPFQNMPILIADTSSNKLNSFIKLISNALKSSIVEHTKVDDYNELVSSSNAILEVYPPDIFWQMDSTSAVSPFNNVSNQFL